MATWSMSRNNYLNAADESTRALQVLILLKDKLKDGGFTLCGAGTGTGGTYSIDTANGITDPFPTFPDTSGVALGAWWLFKNADGVQIVCQIDSNAYLGLWWSATGDYGSSGDAAADARPGNSNPPSDEVALDPNVYRGFGYSSTYYMTVGVTSDSNSFVAFGRTGTVDVGVGFWKAEGAKAGDTHGYASFAYAYPSYGAWHRERLNSSSPEHLRSYHPTAGDLGYCLADLYAGSSYLVEAPLGPDPVSGNEQLIECILCHPSSPNAQIRGKLPDVYRVSSNRSTGDTFNNGDYVCVGQYALPWGSSSEALQ